MRPLWLVVGVVALGLGAACSPGDDESLFGAGGAGGAGGTAEGGGGSGASTGGAGGAGCDCNDGRFCNGQETCGLLPGECVPAVAPSGDDGDACTIDTCTEDDGGGFVHLPIDVDDGDPCTIDFCHPQLGPQHQPIPDCQ